MSIIPLFNWLRPVKRRVVKRKRKLAVFNHTEIERARVMIHSRLEHHNQFLKLPYNRVAVRNQRTRWGSCSVKRNLNFNVRLGGLPEHLLDYVIVHELCHLQHFNHSRQFWDLVASRLPDYKQHRAELKRIRIV